MRIYTFAQKIILFCYLDEKVAFWSVFKDHTLLIECFICLHLCCRRMF